MILTSEAKYKKLSKNSIQKIKVRCDLCGKEYQIYYKSYYKTQEKKGFSGEVVCVKCSTTISNKNRIIDKPGRYINKYGYYMIRVVDNQDRISYQKEHRVLMEKFLGRNLEEDESIHHIDGDKLNNDLENLDVVSSEQHTKAYHSLSNIGYQLYRRGLIGYDRESHTYFLRDENE